MAHHKKLKEVASKKSLAHSKNASLNTLRNATRNTLGSTSGSTFLNTSQSFSLEASKLSLSIDGVCLLKPIDFALPTKKLIAIVGPNGVGKSTLLKVIMGFFPTFSGSLKVMGHSFDDFKNKRAKLVAYMEQESKIDWTFPITVREVVAMGLYAKKSPLSFFTSFDEEKIDEVLSQLSLSHLSSMPIANLSGGEKRRMFLARALLQDANLYLLDEPFANVDAMSSEIMLHIFKKLVAENKTVIIVHHDLVSVRKNFDWCLMLHRGTLDRKSHQGATSNCFFGECSYVMNKKNLATLLSF